MGFGESGLNQIIHVAPFQQFSTRLAHNSDAVD